MPYSGAADTVLEQACPIAEAPQAIDLAAAKADPEALFDCQNQQDLPAGVETRDVDFKIIGLRVDRSVIQHLSHQVPQQDVHFRLSHASAQIAGCSMLDMTAVLGCSSAGSSAKVERIRDSIYVSLSTETFRQITIAPRNECGTDWQ
jgi:hypothetical protein